MGTINDNLFVNGPLSCLQFSPPAGCITDAAVSSASPLQTSKTQHRTHAKWGQPNTTATTETRTVYVNNGTTGTLIGFRAGSIVACLSTASITVDLKKNGTSMLTGVITLNSSSVARVAQAAALASSALVAGDWLEVVITATAGGGTLGTGFFCEAIIDETPT